MSENTIIQQSNNLLDLAGPLMEDIYRKASRLYTPAEIKNLGKVIVTGCGDSYVAGVAAKKAFEALSGLSCRVMLTIDATYNIAEHEVKLSIRDTLAVAISVSGNAGGTVTAVQNLGKLGAKTLAITEGVNSYLAQYSDKILNLNPTEQSVTPGTKTYFASVLSLIMLAAHIGVVRGKLTEADVDALKADIVAYAEAFKGEMENINNDVLKVAEAFKTAKNIEFVGSGIDYATAWFGRAKVYEAIGFTSSAENVEDWAHVNYFFRRPKENACVVVMSKGNPSNSRCLEDIDTMKIMGRPTVVVTDCDCELPEEVMKVKIPSANRDYIAPLLQILPITLLCGHMSDLLGIPFFRGFAEPWKSAGTVGYIANNDAKLPRGARFAK